MATNDNDGVIEWEANELPEGWSVARLPDFIGADGVFSDGDWVETKDQDANGDVRLIQLADIGDGIFKDKSNRFLTSAKAEELDCTFLCCGDVLIARLPEPLGRACLFPGDKKKAVTAVDVCIVRPGRSGCDSRWILHAHALRYDYLQRRWLVWREHWWTPDDNGCVHRMAKEIARLRLRAATTAADLTFARRSEARARLEAMLELAKSELPLADPGHSWDSQPYLLGVDNGVVDLRNGQLRAGMQSDRITLHTAIAFDPAAKAPRWEQFINEVFKGRQELMDYVQRAVGYCLSGETKEQCFFLCYGTGANGKSTFFDVVRYVLGQYAHNLPFTAFELQKHLSIPSEIAGLVGRRFVTAVETNEGVELNAARIKALTGSDPITARFLYREWFTFEPVGKYWLAFNHMPEVTDDSLGFWRRVRIIPFEAHFQKEKADQGLSAKLKAEAPGILAWAVRGCLGWQAEGLGIPQLIEKASSSYCEESDSLRGFLDDRCVIGAAAEVTAASLWSDYVRWAADNCTGTRLDRRGFTSRLEARGFKKDRRGHDRTWTWFGLRLKTPFEPIPLFPPPPADVRADADVKSSFVSEKSKNKPN